MGGRGKVPFLGPWLVGKFRRIDLLSILEKRSIENFHQTHKKDNYLRAQKGLQLQIKKQNFDKETIFLPLQIVFSSPMPLRLVLDCTKTNSLLHTGRLMIPHVVDQLLGSCFHRYFCYWDVNSMYFFSSTEG